MKRPNTKLPTDKTVKRDFEQGTVQPGPGMAPEQAPAEDMMAPGSSEEFQKPGSAGKGQSAQQQKGSTANASRTGAKQ